MILVHFFTFPVTDYMRCKGVPTCLTVDGWRVKSRHWHACITLLYGTSVILEQKVVRSGHSWAWAAAMTEASDSVIGGAVGGLAVTIPWQ